MAVSDIVPVPGARFEETLASASPDFLREMIKGFAQRMMDAEVEEVCGAAYGEVSPDRVNSVTGTGGETGTPGPGRSRWRSRSCCRAPITRNGCWSGAAGRSGRWRPW